MIKEIILNDGSSILCDKINQLTNFVTIGNGRILEDTYTEHQLYKPYIDRMFYMDEIKFWLQIEKYEHKQLKDVENVKVPYSSIKYVKDSPDYYLVGDLKELNVTFQMVGKDKAYSSEIVDGVYRLKDTINTIRKYKKGTWKYRKKYTQPVDDFEFTQLENIVRLCIMNSLYHKLEYKSIDILQPINYDEFVKTLKEV